MGCGRMAQEPTAKRRRAGRRPGAQTVRTTQWTAPRLGPRCLACASRFGGVEWVSPSRSSRSVRAAPIRRRRATLRPTRRGPLAVRADAVEWLPCLAVLLDREQHRGAQPLRATRPTAGEGWADASSRSGRVVGDRGDHGLQQRGLPKARAGSTSTRSFRFRTPRIPVGAPGRGGPLQSGMGAPSRRTCTVSPSVRGPSMRTANCFSPAASRSSDTLST